MAKAIIEITDTGNSPGEFILDVKYDVGDDEDRDIISGAVTYGHLIHYLFNTNKINDYLEDSYHFFNSIKIGTENND